MQQVIPRCWYLYISRLLPTWAAVAPWMWPQPSSLCGCVGSLIWRHDFGIAVSWLCIIVTQCQRRKSSFGSQWQLHCTGPWFLGPFALGCHDTGHHGRRAQRRKTLHFIVVLEREGRELGSQYLFQGNLSNDFNFFLWGPYPWRFVHKPMAPYWGPTLQHMAGLQVQAVEPWWVTNA